MIGWLFTWTCVALGTLGGWANPALGVLIYLLFAILRPEQLWFWSFNPTTSNNFSLMIALSTVIGWLLAGLGDPSALRRAWVPVTGLVVMLLWGLLATVGWARHFDPAWDAWKLQFKFVLMAIVAISTLRSEKQIKAFAWMIALSMGYVAYVYNWYWVIDGVKKIKHPTHGDNNNMALVMVVGVPVAFFMGLYARNLLVKGLTFFLLMCMCHLVLFTFSRGGMLGLIIVALGLLAVMLIKMPRKLLTLTLFTLAVVFTLALAGEQVRTRFWSSFADKEVRDTSAESRLEMFPVGLSIMKSNPEGLGPRNTPLTMSRYGFGTGKLLHDAYLQIGCDWGVIGLAGWLTFYLGAFFLTLFTSMSKVAQRLGWPVYFGRMVCISLLGYFACAAFLSCERIEPPGIIAVLGLCTYAHCKRVAEQEKPSRRKRRGGEEPDPTPPAPDRAADNPGVLPA